jgi:apolipoprotein N-acyltransferase
METQQVADLGLIIPRLILDFVAICILLLGLYFRNYRRPDLVAVFLACNVGLFSVLTTLSFSPISSAVGFALFGVLSIIRLRSFEFLPTQIAYFFISLAIALICATDLAGLLLPFILVVFMIVAMALVDSERFRSTTESSVIVVDTAIPDPVELAGHLSKLLNANIIHMKITGVNLLQETTTVDVTFRRISK